MTKKPEPTKLKPYVEIVFVPKLCAFEEPNCVNKLINCQRGFPNGFSLKKYKNQEDCEKVSPGIAKAQSNAEAALHLVLKCRVYIDKDGCAQYEIIKPKHINDIKIVEN